MNDSLKQKYFDLIGKKPNQATLDRLEKISKALNIRDDDILWSFFLGLEVYDKLFEEHPEKLRQALMSLQRETPIQAWLWLLIAIAGVVIIGSICFLGGVAIGNGDIPPWMVTKGTLGAITAPLRVPAGWIFIISLLPGNIYLTIRCFSSYRYKKMTPLALPSSGLENLLGLPLAISLNVMYFILAFVIIAISI